MKSKSAKQSLRYKLWKKTQYDKAIRKLKNIINSDYFDSIANTKIAKNIYSYIQDASTMELTLLPKYSEVYSDRIQTRLIEGAGVAANIRMKKLLKQAVDELLDLGIQHSILDRLYEFKRVRKILDNQPANFSSLTGNLVDFVVNDTDYGVAEFNSLDDLTPKELESIIKSEKELNRMADSLDKMEERGELADFPTKNSRIARMSYEERYRFLFLIKDIDNFRARAEASKKKFVADTYLENRRGVLANDFQSKYDDYIKARVASFISEESRYMTSIKGKDASAANATDDIRRKLAEKDRALLKGTLSAKDLRKEISKKQKQYENRAQMFLATEVSTAYNFGKLIGFSSLEDLNKRFRWNADWELQTRNSNGDYEVCDACAAMDGNTYTVRDLLVIGTQLDVGAGGFGKNRSNRTDFKNPSLPQIPFHPMCNCYWTLEDDNMRLDSEQIYEDIPIDSVRQLDPEGKLVPKAKGNLVASLAGVGLLVGSAYLLSRSNYWNAFASSVMGKYTFPTKTFTNTVLDTVDYVTDTYTPDIAKAVTDTVMDAAGSAATARPISVPTPTVPRVLPDIPVPTI
jgi:hypothetical protein